MNGFWQELLHLEGYPLFPLFYGVNSGFNKPKINGLVSGSHTEVTVTGWFKELIL